jgi:hypothetical protein
MSNEIIGFIFREILNEIVELALDIKEKRRLINDVSCGGGNGSGGGRMKTASSVLTSSEIFETCRVFSLQRNNQTCISHQHHPKYLLI